MTIQNPMTAEQVRAEVESAKRKAMKRFDKDMGAGSWDRLVAYSKSDANRRALDSICDALKD